MTAPIQRKRGQGVNIQEFLAKHGELLKKRDQPRKQAVNKTVVVDSVEEGFIPKAKVVSVPSPRITVKKAVQKRRENSDFQTDKRFRFVDPSAVEDRDILLKYFDWFALPRCDRKPKLQKEFAEVHGVHYNTLTAWKGLVGFWDEVKIRRDVVFRRYASEIYIGLVKRAKTGSAREVELYARLFDGYGDKLKIENTPSEMEITPEESALIANALKNIGLASIIATNNQEQDTEEQEDEDGM